MAKVLVEAVPVVITQELLDSGCTTTVSNVNGGWALIHAPTDAEYRREMDRVRALPYGERNKELCSAQIRLSARFVSVEPTWCIRGDGYWYLRNTSNLGPTFPAGRGQWSSLQACMNAALEWCLQHPERREAVVRTSCFSEENQPLSDNAHRAAEQAKRKQRA